MKVLVRRSWAWGDLYGRTHRGARWFLFGIPIWRWRRRVRP